MRNSSSLLLLLLGKILPNTDSLIFLMEVLACWRIAGLDRAEADGVCVAVKAVSGVYKVLVEQGGAAVRREGDSPPG